MANRNFFQFFYALENDPVFLWAKWKINPLSSAVSNVQTKSYGKGISSITKSATGKFIFALEDRYSRFIAMHSEHENYSTVVNSHDQLLREQVNDASAPLIEVGFHDGSSFADPASSTYIYTEFVLKNSSVGN